MSIRVTRWPSDSSASATPAPEVSETSRSDDQPPIRTATWRVVTIPPSNRHSRESGNPAALPGRRRSGIPAFAGTTGKIEQELSRLVPHPLYLPLQFDPRMRLHPPAHFIAQRLDVGGGRPAEVEQEVGVLLRNLRVADPKTPA